MKFSFFLDKQWGQFLIFPTIGITYDLSLMGAYELYFSWFGYIAGMRYGDELSEEDHEV